MTRAAVRIPAENVAPEPLALGRLFEDYAPLVRSLARQLARPGVDPDDIFQDAFVLAWRKLQDDRGQDLRAWISGIVVRVAAAAGRRVWLRKHLGLEAIADLADWHSPERDAANSEQVRLLRGALDAMSEKRRTAFVLFELNGLSGQEIAAALHCPLKTVHTRLFHARKDFAEFVRAARANGLHEEGR